MIAKRPIGPGCWVENETECQGFHSSSDDRTCKSSESNNNDKKMPIKSFKGPIKAFVCFCANPIFCNFSQKRFYNLELWYNNDQGFFQDNSRSTKFNNFPEQRDVKASKR